MKTFQKCVRLFLVAGVGLLSRSGYGDNRIWNSGGGDHNWSTAANWGGTAPIASDALIFGSGARVNTTNDLTANTEFAGITITNGTPAFTHSGNAINLGGDLADLSTAAQTFHLPMELTGNRNLFVTNGGTLNLNGVVSGNFGLTKAGAGLLLLTNANTHAGGTILSNGTLDIRNDGALGTNVLTLAGGTLQGFAVSPGNRIVAQSGSTVTVQLSGGGDLNLNGDLSGNGTINAQYGGGSGTRSIRLGGNNNAYSGTCSMANNNSVRYNFGTTNSGSANAIWDLNNWQPGNNSGHSFGFSIGTIQLGALTGVGGIRGNNAAGSVTLVIGGLNTNATWSGNISANNGAINVIKIGTGTQTFTTANGYSGGTIISNGTLAIQVVTALGGGAVQLAGGTLEVTNNLSFGNNITLQSAGGSIRVAASSTFTNTGTISGSAGGGLVKRGPGTLVLTAINTYDGATTVSNGMLRIAGTQPAGALNVAVGARLSGNGTVNGPINLASGAAAIDLRNGVGETLTAAGGLHLVNGNELKFEIGTASDAIAVSGSSSISGTTSIHVTNLAGFAVGNYPIITGVPGISAANFAIGSSLDGYDLQLVDDTVDTLYLVVGLLAPSEAWWSGDVDNTWTNLQAGDSNWDTDQSSATDAGVIPATPTAVKFAADGAANLNTVLGANFAIDSLTFLTANNVSIGGTNDLAIQSGVAVQAGAGTNVIGNGRVLLTASQTWQNDSDKPLIVNAPVSGSASLTKTGTGELRLNSTNSFTGGTTVSAGTLTLGHPTDTLADTSPVTVIGATLSMGANSDVVGAVTMTNGAISGSGALSGSSFALADGSVSAALAGAGGVTKSGSGTLLLSGSNSYAGATTIKQGNVNINGGAINNAAAVTVGDTAGQVASLSVTNGAITSGGISIGTAAGANGNQLILTNATLFSSGELIQANNAATGNFVTLLGNVTWNMNTNTVRGRSPEGAITIAGGSVMTNVGNLWIGNGNHGATLRIESGGKLYQTIGGAAVQTDIGRDSGNSTNRIIVTDSGSLWNVGARDLRIGGAAAGSNWRDNQLLVANGAIVTNMNRLFISDFGTGFNNQCVITNGGLVYVNGEVRISMSTGGQTNNGVLISSGGKLFSGITSTDPTIGYSTGTRDAFVQVTGAGSLWNIGGRSLHIGGNTAGTLTTNNFLKIDNFGMVTNVANIYIGDWGQDISNHVTISDGGVLVASALLSVGQDSDSVSNYFVLGGAGAVSTARVGAVSVGANGGDYNQILIANGELYSSGQVQIGAGVAGADYNSATIGAGGYWNCGGQQFGSRAGTGNVMTITSGGILTNIGNFIIGDFATARDHRLIVSNGGKLYTGAGGTTWALGYNSGAASNSILVTGSGSLWDAGGRTFVIGGASGVNTGALLRVESGGVFTNGALTLGNVDPRLVISGGVVHASSLNIGAGGLATLQGGQLVTTSITVSALGEFRVLNDYTQTATRVLTVGLTGNHTNGLVAVQGTASLGGTLTVVTNGGFVPVPGDSFTVMTYTAKSGDFAATNLPALTPGLVWNVDVQADKIVLNVGGDLPVYYWDSNGAGAGLGGTGSWDTNSALWRRPDTNGALTVWPNTEAVQAEAVFADVAGTVNVTEPMYAQKLQFLASGFALTNGQIRLGSSSPATITLSNGAAATIAASLATTNGVAIFAQGGVLTLSGTNSHGGTTALRSGTVNLQAGVSGTTRILVATNAGDVATLNLQPTGGTITAGIASPSVVVATEAGTTGTVNMSAGTLVGGAGNEIWIGPIAGGKGTFNLSGGNVLNSSWGVVGRSGNGELNISGGSWTNAVANNFVISSFAGATGRVTVSSGRLVQTSDGQLWVGEGGVGILTINGGEVRAERNAYPALVAGRAGGGAGSIRLNGGTLFSDDATLLGHGTGTAGSYGAMTQTGGSFTSDWWFVVGANNDRAVFNQSGGSFAMNNGYMTVGAGGLASIAVATFAGGGYTAINGASGGLLVGEFGRGEANVMGSANLSLAFNGLYVGVAAGATGRVNLAGGTVNANIVKKGAGAGTINFHGGTLKATGASTNFMTGLDGAYVFGGGLVLDDGGFVVEIAQPLLAPTGAGVASVAVTNGGANYIDSPIVTIAGDGVGATAIAQIDYVNGTVTNILVTNPGRNYTTATATLQSGGGAGAGLGAVSLNGGNASGGLTKQGVGTLTLSGVSTYSGTTRVQTGTLALASGGALATTAITVNAGATFAPAADFTNTGVKLTIEITGASTHGRVAEGATAYLGGNLTVVTNGYAPVFGNVFTVLTASAVSGTFATTNLPALAPTNAWQVTYAPTHVQLAVVSSGAPPPTGYDAYALQITNGLAGIQDDADGDGYANLLEYVTGGNPTNNDEVARMQIGRTNGILQLKFTRTTNSVDARLVVEGSDSLTNNATWIGINTNIAGAWGDPGHVVETGAGSPVNVTVSDVVTGAPQRNLRLKVLRP